MKKILSLSLAASIATFSACYHSEIKEQTIGPFITVCCEKYTPYEQTTQTIDSLKKELDQINIEYNQAFAIFYEKETDNNTKYHSIVGYILPQKTEDDSSTIIKLERNKFNIRKIGATNCITIESQTNTYNKQYSQKAYQTINQYIETNNYLPIPNGENGITEIYEKDKTIYAAEIKKNK